MNAPKKTSISGWGNYPQVETVIEHFQDRFSFRDTNKVSKIARGLGRSYSDQAVNSDGKTLFTDRLNKFISFDEVTSILECEAGVSLEDIIVTFAPGGWFPMICPGTKYVTIGGAIANDIHGKAHHSDGSFINCVESFTILLANGEIRNASREENSDLFFANFGGLGLLGIILTAKVRLIRIETTYFQQKALKIKDLDDLLIKLTKYDKDYKYSVAWIDPAASGKNLGRGVLTVGNPARISDLPERLKKDPLVLHPSKKINLPFYLPNFSLNSISSKLLNKVISVTMSSPKEFVHYEKFLFPLDAIKNWNRGYGKRGFIQYQFVLPVETSNSVIAKILDQIVKSHCTPFLNVFKKMGPKQGLLSFPMEGYTLAIDFPMSKRLQRFIPKIDQLVKDAGGRIYLGKDALLDKNTFTSMYPEVREWMEIKSKYDPENIFSSNISRRLGLTPEM